MAEDAAQEAMVALVRGARGFGAGRAFLPWFRALALNAARMAARGRGRRVKHEARAHPARREEPDLDAEEVNARAAALPHDLRSAIVLHYYEALSHEEVAEALGCPKGTASSRIRRGDGEWRVHGHDG